MAIAQSSSDGSVVSNPIVYDELGAEENLNLCQKRIEKYCVEMNSRFVFDVYSFECLAFPFLGEFLEECPEMGNNYHFQQMVSHVGKLVIHSQELVKGMVLAI